METSYPVAPSVEAARPRRESLLARTHARILLSRALLLTTVGVFAFLLAVVATLSRGHSPAPRIHDEFSYLLAADTYAHGRLTNPTHPLWEHFESFHILQRPTYASKYPPAQGLFMAVGQLLTGEPIVGVWLSYALMCAAISWMLLAWASPRWALWGGIFTALWLVGLQSDAAYWVRTFWGGSVAVLGGALLMGGVRRLTIVPRVRDALLTALGLGILANSRPFEGLLVSIVPGLALLVWLFRARVPSFRQRLTTAVLPLAIALGAIGAWMGYYNYRVTGRVTQLPYMTYEQEYATSSAIAGTKEIRSPRYRHAVMREFYYDEKKQPGRHVSLSSTLRSKVKKVRELGDFFIPQYAFVLLLMLPWVLSNRWNLLAAGSLTAGGIGILITGWTFPHYAAPLVPSLVILLVGCARRLNLLRMRRDRVGVYLSRFILACAAFSALASIAGKVVARGVLVNEWEVRRAAVVHRLESQPSNHIVLVTYRTGHDVDNEWVYNPADIDGAKVVWARSMSAERDQRLLRYFANRTAWALEISYPDSAFKLSPLNATLRP